jgi:hypothetical protein
MDWMNWIGILGIIIAAGVMLFFEYLIVVEHPANVKFCQSHGYKDYVINDAEFCLTDANTLKPIIKTSTGEKIIVN